MFYVSHTTVIGSRLVMGSDRKPVEFATREEASAHANKLNREGEARGWCAFVYREETARIAAETAWEI